jgi:formate C-acetyltransferase
MDNWEGHEQLRERIIAEVPHYGNDDPYVDEEVRWLADMYHELCGHYYSERSMIYKSGLYGASDHVNQGFVTWATPDGRLTGTPLADATSPSQGRDKSGPTAIFNSACAFDHNEFMDGLALNIKIHPTSVSNDDGMNKLKNLTQTYFDDGGMEVQYNIVSSDTLRKAQEDPSSYRDLVVRIAGFSAYFVDMAPELQNDIISRNEVEI